MLILPGPSCPEHAVRDRLPGTGSCRGPAAARAAPGLTGPRRHRDARRASPRSRCPSRAVPGGRLRRRRGGRLRHGRGDLHAEHGIERGLVVLGQGPSPVPRVGSMLEARSAPGAATMAPLSTAPLPRSRTDRPDPHRPPPPRRRVPGAATRSGTAGGAWRLGEDAPPGRNAEGGFTSRPGQRSMGGSDGKRRNQEQAALEDGPRDRQRALPVPGFERGSQGRVNRPPRTGAEATGETKTRRSPLPAAR